MTYTLDDIKHQETIEAIRENAGMYIGSVDADGVYQIFLEVVSNAIDEHLNGFCNKIEVNIGDMISIKDNGRGIPFGEDKEKFISIFTKSHTGGKFAEQENYKTSGGQHGVGVKATNALSQFFKVISSREGQKVEAIFEKGENTFYQISAASTKLSSTEIIFLPDPDIFGAAQLDFSKVEENLETFSYLCPGLKIILNHGSQKHEFLQNNGLAGFVEKLTTEKKITPINTIDADDFSLAFCWTTASKPRYQLFTNLIPNSDGTHLTGLKTGLNAAFKQFTSEKITSEDIMKGFCFVLSIKMKRPVYGSQNKEKLTSQEARSWVNGIVAEGMTKFLEENPQAADKLIAKFTLELKAEEAAARMREKILSAKKDFSAKSINSFNKKFIDTPEKDREKCELFLVEGDSAGNSIKATKGKNQALATLRGKILSVQKADWEQIIKNEEILMIAKGLGASLGERGFTITNKNLRFGKIIIATDADEDGYHIRSLLLTLFYSYFPKLLQDGRIYALAPKLFKVRAKGQDHWFANETEMAASGVRGEISRFKGLGSYSNEEFAPQIHPATRSLIKFTLKDIEKAQKAIKLMQKDGEARQLLAKGEYND